MKKILLFASALAGLFLAGSCQRENLEPVGGNTVTFTVEAPGAIATKGTINAGATIADGTNVNEVHYAVYKTHSGVDYSIDDSGAIDGPLAQGVVPMENKRASIDFDLLQDQEYTVIFWAQVKDAGHYTLGDLRTIKVANSVMGNDETRAAFYARYDFSTYEHKDHKVTLRRPFAQLNLLTTAESLTPVQTGQTQGYTIDVKKSEVVVVGLAAEFNTLTGLAPAGDAQFMFQMADTPEEQGQETLVVNGKAYHYVSMNYFFVPQDEKLVDIKYTVSTDKGDIKNEIVSVPVKENYRTNIIGNLLTKESTFEIVVDAEFDGQNLVEVWDGREVSEPAKNAEGQYVISTASELAWLSAAVNGTLPVVTKATEVPAKQTFINETFVLLEDIDLENIAWTPIGNVRGSNKEQYTWNFKGTFDGNGHVIKNLKVNNANVAGLFGYMTQGTVRNLTIEGFELDAEHYAGAIVGWNEGSKTLIENCTVLKGDIELTVKNGDLGDKAGAIVGFAHGGTYSNNTAAEVTIKGYRDLGGVAGNLQSDGKLLNNKVSAVTVIADQTVEYAEVKDINAGEIVGRINSDKVQIEDNKYDNVTVIRKVDATEELAYAVAEAQSGDTIYVGAEVTMPYFTGKALNFEGLTKSAVVKQSPATHIDEFYAGAELNFKGLTLVGTAYLNNTQGYQKAVKETYTECDFQDYIMFAGDETIINKCNFTSTVGQYFWTGTADVITFNECKFDVLERAIKVCTVGNNGERVVNINNCQFKAATQKKAAIEIDGTKGSSYVVNINSCTETGFAKGEFTDLAMFNVEGADNVQVYLDGAKWFRNGVMEENGELFAYSAAGLQYLLDNAVNGETVKVGADIEGDVTVTQKADVMIAIEGNNHKYAGVITVDGKSATYKTAGVTIKNLNFKAETISADACIRLGMGNNNTRYTCNVAVEGCNFAVPGAVAVKSYTGGDHNLSIKKCTGAGLHSLTQLKNVTGVTIEEVNITGGRGASFGQSSNIVVKNSTFVAESYGLRVDAESEAVLAIENVNITAKLPVVARKTSKNYTINFTGVNNLVAGGYQVVFTTGDDEAAFVAPAEYTLTGAEGFKVFPRDADTYNYVYNADELQAAIDAGKKSIVLQPGKYEKTINLKSDVTIEGLEGAIVNCMNLNGADNVTLRNIAFDAAGAQMAYDGKGNARFMANIMSGGASKNGSGTEGLVVEGCTFTGTFANGGTVIAFNDQGRGSGQSGNITIKGCTFATEGAYVDIYTYYSGKGKFIIENNIFNSTVVDRPIYLGRYQSSTPVVVKGNAFKKCADFAAATYIQAHSGAYTVSFDESGNTFAE